MSGSAQSQMARDTSKKVIAINSGLITINNNLLTTPSFQNYGSSIYGNINLEVYSLPFIIYGQYQWNSAYEFKNNNYLKLAFDIDKFKKNIEQKYSLPTDSKYENLKQVQSQLKSYGQDQLFKKRESMQRQLDSIGTSQFKDSLSSLENLRSENNLLRDSLKAMNSGPNKDYLNKKWVTNDSNIHKLDSYKKLIDQYAIDSQELYTKYINSNVNTEIKQFEEKKAKSLTNFERSMMKTNKLELGGLSLGEEMQYTGQNRLKGFKYARHHKGRLYSISAGLFNTSSHLFQEKLNWRGYNNYYFSIMVSSKPKLVNLHYGIKHISTRDSSGISKLSSYASGGLEFKLPSKTNCHFEVELRMPWQQTGKIGEQQNQRAEVNILNMLNTSVEICHKFDKLNTQFEHKTQIVGKYFYENTLYAINNLLKSESKLTKNFSSPKISASCGYQYTDFNIQRIGPYKNKLDQIQFSATHFKRKYQIVLQQLLLKNQYGYESYLTKSYSSITQLSYTYSKTLKTNTLFSKLKYNFLGQRIDQKYNTTSTSNNILTGALEAITKEREWLLGLKYTHRATHVTNGFHDKRHSISLYINKEWRKWKLGAIYSLEYSNAFALQQTFSPTLSCAIKHWSFYYFNNTNLLQGTGYRTLNNLKISYKF
jgi:hypothetical protein